MEFILGVFIVGYVLYPFYLGHKVKHLENRLAELESGRFPAERAQTKVDGQLPPMPTAEEVERSNQGQDSVVPTGQSYFESTQTKPNAFYAWLKQDFFVKLGALLLLMAFGWLVSYAFINDWIGPVGRISLGLLLGVIFLGLGTWRIRTHVHQGGIFTVVGATTVLLTIFAAREIYDFFDPLSALLLMFATVVFVAFVSVRYQSQALALAGLILGCIAPLFTSAPQPNISGLFFYLLIIVLGTLWVVAITGWSRLTLGAMIIVFAYSLPFMFSYLGQAEQDTALMYSFIFVTIFYIANIVSLIRRSGPQHRTNHLLTALGSAFFLFIWIQVAVVPEWQSLLYVAWAVVFSAGAYIVYFYTENRLAFYLYGGTGLALIAAATAAELDGPTLTIAYLFEVAVLVLVAVKLQAGRSLVQKLSVLFVVPVALALPSTNLYLWHQNIVNEHFVVVTLVPLVLILVGHYITRTSKAAGGSANRAGTILLTAGLVFVFVWVWLVAHALLTDDVGTTLSLVVYTISGIAFYVEGKRNDHKLFRLSGICLITFVLVRLLLVEVWTMNLGGKIVTFFIVGILLISTAFIKRSKTAAEINNLES